MPRYALKIEYHGGPFKGWQRQDKLPTVQGCVEAALGKLDEACEGVVAAGRTDTGVHGTGQVVHTDLVQEWDPFRLSEALNYHLKPQPVAVVDAAAVDDAFHARFSARERHYLFRLFARRAPAALEGGLVWQIKHHLDIEAMRAGAAHLIGAHDFTTFRSTMCQAKSPQKTMDAIEIEQLSIMGGVEYQFRLRARSFLHNQVRSIVGTLERVGAGAWDPSEVKAALEAKDRSKCGPVCPPQGLYLERVIYPTDPFI